MTEIKNDALERKRKKQRIVETHTERDYYLNGKRVNKNVYELQKLYESTQAKSTKVLPEFVERIRFMVVNGICKASYTKSVDQQGELFNYVLETLLSKIVPKRNKQTKKLETKYKPERANLGAYILNSCYWSVIAFQGDQSWNESLLGCSEYLEDYDLASETDSLDDLGKFKFIKNYEASNSYLPLIQQILEGSSNEN